MEVLDSVLVGSLSHLYVNTSKQVFMAVLIFFQVEANNQFRMSAEKIYMLRIEHFTVRSAEPK